MSPRRNQLYLISLLILISAIFAWFSLAEKSKSVPMPLALNPVQQIAPITKKEFSSPNQLEIAPVQQDPSDTSKTAALKQVALPFDDIVHGARVIEEKSSIPDSNGWQTRTRLLESSFKYPLVEIEEEVRLSDQGPEEVRSRKALVADHILVRLVDDSDKAALDEINSRFGNKIREQIFGPNLYLISFDHPRIGDAKAKAIQYMQEKGSIAIAEPDYLGSGGMIPDDPSFGSLWGLNNGSDVDIDAPEAWDLGLGSQDVIVGVIDSGVDYNHADLANRMWQNPGEIPGNGIDDDSNGYIDDVYGRDFYNNDSDPMDDHGHGTHCSGTIGAAFNNAVGVSGIAPRSKIMALKWLNSSNSGTSSAAVAAVYYATQKGARITSNSWGISGFSINLYFAIDNARASGSLFVAAAMNNGVNIDASPQYPASHSPDLDNIISVAATNSNDEKPSWSNYGPTNVHLGAPGVSILSTINGGGYASWDGTSMATPHVSGAAAYLWSLVPTASYTTVKNCIVNSGDPIAALAGITVSGRRLNLRAAAECILAGAGPTPTSTPTSVSTNTPTPTPTKTPTRTATSTNTTVPTNTNTAAPTATNTATNTSTVIPTATATRTATHTVTQTATPSKTSTSAPTSTQTNTATPTRTTTATHTPTTQTTATSTPNATATASRSATATSTATNTATSVTTGTATPSATNTATASPTSITSGTTTATPTAIPSSSSTATPNPSSTASNLSCSEPLVFNAKRFTNYGPGGKGEMKVLESGTVIELSGDAWKAFPKSYQVTPGTVLSFDFKVGVEGLFNAIGLDRQRAKVDPTTFFALNGPKPQGIEQYMNTYTRTSDGWQHYEIPIGKHRTLLASYMTFINAASSNDRLATSAFRDIRICEPMQAAPTAFACETNLKFKDNKATLIVKRPGINDSNKPTINALMLMHSIERKSRVVPIRITRTRPGKAEFTINPKLLSYDAVLFLTTDAPDCFATEIKVKSKNTRINSSRSHSTENEQFNKH